MTLDPVQRDLVSLARRLQRLPEFDVLDRFIVGGLPALFLPAENPLGDAILDVSAIGVKIDLARGLQRIERLKAAISSMRLLVVSASPPFSSFSTSP